jgi:Methylamine utilisation protein MauE
VRVAMSGLSFVIRLALALVLLGAVGGKLRNLSDFRDGIHAYRIVPRFYVPALVAAIPLLETVVGLTLLANFEVSAAAAVCGAMFAAFTTAQVVNYAKGNRVPCHCFGGDATERISVATVSRGALLTGMAGVVVAIGASPSPGLESILPLAGIASGVALSIRLISILPVAIHAFRQTGAIAATPPGRVSFKHSPIDTPLGAILSATEAASTNGNRTAEPAAR